MSKLNHKHLRFLGKYDNIDFYEYTPTLFSPYYTDYPEQDHPHYEKRLVHKIRMMTEYLRGGYRVYYMADNGEIVGHLVVANGARRLKVSKKDDIVIGPIFISPSKRGKGLGTIGIHTVLNELKLDYNYAYEFIADDNIASIRTVEKNGYVYAGRAKESGLMKNLIECDDGDFVIYRYCKK